MRERPDFEVRVPAGVLVAIALCLLASAAAAGATALCFECDDAYITYRFVANAHAGHGLVWNPAPFLPVEGYSSFGWALLLWGAWSWFGVEPPTASLVLSFGCGLLQFAIVARALLTMRSAAGEPAPVWLALSSLTALVGCRTWLQWWSSGLETPLFVALTVAWVLLAFRRVRPGGGSFGLWMLLAVLSALVRPDGLLYVAATITTGVVWWLRRAWPGRCLVVGGLPVLMVVAHLLWRRWFYGEWLPNTYYAKVSTPWPDAGVRYLASFVIEHGVWWWLLLVAAWLLPAARRWRAARTVSWPALAATAAMLLQVGYYVVQVGGDHFEYRVFAHLVPLMVVATQRMALDVARAPWARAAWPAGLLVASGFGWFHLAASWQMPVNGLWQSEHQVPALLRPIARVHDRLQGWLHLHFVCLRCNQHAQTLAALQAQLPERGPAQAAPGDVPVLAVGAIGWLGWVLPDVALLDRHGLCDWVVARTPPDLAAGEAWRQLLSKHLREGERNGDGWIDRDELRGVVSALFDGNPMDSEGDRMAADALVAQVLFLAASRRAGALAIDEVGVAVDAFVGRRMMAHERLPPHGYEDAFAPNAAIVDGRLRITPRPEPLGPERIVDLEATWRSRVRGASD
ncbi:MAG: hypothetical protein H6835_03135 [Planctomycetes bacterium]|nr:hypothetical protein [Planctomycetota bacterium]